MQHNDGAEPGTRAGPSANTGRSDAEWLGVARLGLAPGQTDDSSLWDQVDLTDPEDRRFGDFELLERIGRGGMGVVFRAFQHSLGREVAIKFIVGALVDHPAAVSTFFAEARAAARLHHPHIVPVFESGQIDGQPYFSMPLLGGETLAQRIQKGRFDPKAAVDLLLTLCAAVSYAHELGLLHLDLKPGNVLFDDGGRALISDFGLARHIDAKGGVDAHGGSGTAAYMAPEQSLPGVQRLDPRTDVYALGAILHELLTGRSPHGPVKFFDHGQRPRSAASDSAGSLDSDISPDLQAICQHCLQPEPQRRYQTVAALQADLTRLRDGNPVSVRMPTAAERLQRVFRRYPGIASGSALAVLALIAGLFATSWQWHRAELARADASLQRDFASVEADRATQLAGFMAAAFPSDDVQSDGRSRNAHNAVAWLKQNAADPAAQRALLSAFRKALDAANKGEAVVALTNEIIDQLGSDYREQQVQRLVARDDRTSLIAATLIGIPRSDDESSPAHEAAMRRLVEGFPDDPLALYTAALACHVQRQPCAHGDYFDNLVARYPDNAVNWVLVASGPKPADRVIAGHVLGAAQATEFNDQLAALSGVMQQALAEQPLPPSILLPMQAVVSESEVAPALRRNALDQVPLPMYADILRICKPDSAAIAQTDGLREACAAFALLGLHSNQVSILGRMISSAMLRRLFKGGALAHEAWEYRRQYVWLGEHLSSDPVERERLQQELARYGEWEAVQRQVERTGFPRLPPPYWLPSNPELLLLSEDRKPAAGRQ